MHSDEVDKIYPNFISVAQPGGELQRGIMSLLSVGTRKQKKGVCLVCLGRNKVPCIHKHEFFWGNEKLWVLLQREQHIMLGYEVMLLWLECLPKLTFRENSWTMKTEQLLETRLCTWTIVSRKFILLFSFPVYSTRSNVDWKLWYRKSGIILGIDTET